LTTLGLQQYRPVFIAGCAAVFIAFVGASFTDLSPWYQQLNKPSWQPPDWMFGPAWTAIFALVAVAAYDSWNQSSGEARGNLVGLFCFNGFLNVLWSLLFFRLQRPDWALIEVIFLWASIVLLILYTRRYSLRASKLLMPYLAWVSFAAVLNLAVVRLNGPF